MIGDVAEYIHQGLGVAVPGKVEHPQQGLFGLELHPIEQGVERAELALDVKPRVDMSGRRRGARIAEFDEIEDVFEVRAAREEQHVMMAPLCRSIGVGLIGERLEALDQCVAPLDALGKYGGEPHPGRDRGVFCLEVRRREVEELLILLIFFNGDKKTPDRSDESAILRLLLRHSIVVDRVRVDDRERFGDLEDDLEHVPGPEAKPLLWQLLARIIGALSIEPREHERVEDGVGQLLDVGALVKGSLGLIRIFTQPRLVRLFSDEVGVSEGPQQTRELWPLLSVLVRRELEIGRDGFGATLRSSPYVELAFERTVPVDLIGHRQPPGRSKGLAKATPNPWAWLWKWAGCLSCFWKGSGRVGKGPALPCLSPT